MTRGCVGSNPWGEAATLGRGGMAALARSTRPTSVLATEAIPAVLRNVGSNGLGRQFRSACSDSAALMNNPHVT